MENKNNDRMTTIAGRLFALILAGCVSAILIALTTKLVLWII